MRRWGPFEVLGTLGQGGAGSVFRVRDPRSGESFALKLLDGADERAQKRFAREAAALARLDHPHVVRVRRHGVESGRPYLLLDLVNGSTLEERLSRGPLAARQAARLVAKVAQAVAHAHARNVLHRDLKPENVLLDEADEPQLTDFGLTRDVLPRASQTRLSQDGVILGTPSYWAPEQARGDVQGCGTHTDVYGLGALLYASLTAHPPHEGQSLVALMANAQELPQAPSAHVPGLDPELERLCLQALAPEPAERPLSAQAFADALGAYLEGRGSPTARRPATRRVGVALAGALVVLGLALALGVLWGRPGRVPAEATGATPNGGRAGTPTPAPTPTPSDAVVDAATLIDVTRLPTLEVRDPWAVDASEGSIRLRAHPRAQPELRLPLRLDGDAIEVEARLQLDAFELGNELSLLLQRSTPAGDLRLGVVMLSSTEELYDTRARALAWRSRGVSERDVHQLAELVVEGSLTLRLRYTPRGGLVASLQRGDEAPVSALIAEPGDLGRGHYWLRLGFNLPADLEAGLVGASGHDDGAAARARVESLRVEHASPLLLDTEGLSLSRLNTTARAGRQLVSGRDFPGLIESLRGLILTEETGRGAPNIGSFLLMLPLAELRAGREDDAAQSIGSARILTSLTELGRGNDQPSRRWLNAWTSAWPCLSDRERRVFAQVEAEARGLSDPRDALDAALRLRDQTGTGIRTAALASLLYVQAGDLSRAHAEAVAQADYACGDLERAGTEFWRASAQAPGAQLWAGLAAYRLHDMPGAVAAWEGLRALPRDALAPEARDLADYALSDLLERARRLR